MKECTLGDDVQKYENETEQKGKLLCYTTATFVWHEECVQRKYFVQIIFWICNTTMYDRTLKNRASLYETFTVMAFIIIRSSLRAKYEDIFMWWRWDGDLNHLNGLRIKKQTSPRMSMCNIVIVYSFPCHNHD